MSRNNEVPEPNDEQIDHENDPGWGAFPDLLRVQEPQQNGAGLPDPSLRLQRAGVANPPDVSLPGSAGRDPPPPDFNIDPSSRQNQQLPDMALDASQAQAAERPRCSGARDRTRREPVAPNSLAEMAQAAVSDNGIGDRRAPFEDVQMDRVYRELHHMREEITTLRRSYRTLEGGFRHMERLLELTTQEREEERMRRRNDDQRRQRDMRQMSEAFAESLQLAMTHFLGRLNADPEDRPREGD